ncbi:alpha amylase C-terminal domain-containing protein [Thermophagus sp. OGC60D27]|uniref:alpha amylase C-terminal domain-containing protein n=1 Tax=Thermophagus sp. OGC60D27 TaxID=3458415 RepID=UPI0040381C6F
MHMLNLIEKDEWLRPYASALEATHSQYLDWLEEIRTGHDGIIHFAGRHQFFGLHTYSEGWVFREWAPNAEKVYLVGDFSDWKPNESFRLQRKDHGIWEIFLSASIIKHKDCYKLYIEWAHGSGFRIPAYARRVVQDPETLLFSAQVWHPEKPFQWSDQNFHSSIRHPFIYEAHVGMAQEEGGVGTYQSFTEEILPRIQRAGYNVIQLMAIQEHPYYGSFGYHVSNFFAPSSRFGTPEDLKNLINQAHEMGLCVIMDIVHSHAVKNEEEGLSRFDGTLDQYFYPGERGFHPAWDSRCFDYGKKEVVAFLLSNCRYWLEEFHFDGFRFDGVTSMLYTHHGLGKAISGYHDYFDNSRDDHALVYLKLANHLIHKINPKAITIAEEVSGYPGTGSPPEEGGLGFDYRLSMGVPDFWIKLIKEIPDEEWSMGTIFHELTIHRPEEQTISYAESHDQALVGDKTIIFRLADKEMYDSMSKDQPNLIIDRAVALHKIIRLVTLTTANGGYLNFMGNEFGHPEWIDFPREGNNWSYQYARRQWSLADDDNLKYQWLGNFDRAMITTVKEHDLLSYNPVYLNLANEGDNILAFNRGPFLMVFNFHPTRSFPDYGIPVAPGKYRILFQSDDPQFGGFDRIDQARLYFAQPVNRHPNSGFQLKLYLPNRTGLILEKIPTPKIH